jgi:SNF2 family DNA or RNA helicase
MSRIPLFSEKEILQWVGASEVEKGRTYQTAVSAVTVRENRVTALVQGRLRQPYRVEVSWTGGTFSGFCTCPVSVRCKHVAAVLLTLLNPPEGRKERQKASLRLWIDSVRAAARSSPERPPGKPGARSILLWSLFPEPGTRRFGVRAFKARLKTGGALSSQIEPWNNFDRALTTPADFLDETDRKIIWHLRRANQNPPLHDRPWSLCGKEGEIALGLLLESGRFVGGIPDPRPLGRGVSRPGSLAWVADPEGTQHPEFRTVPESDALLVGQSLWYVDLGKGEIGQIQSEIAPLLLEKVLASPPLDPEDTRLAEALLKDVLPSCLLPATAQPGTIRTVGGPPVPVLKLSSLKTRTIRAHREYTYSWYPQVFDGARVFFRYGSILVPQEDPAGYVIDNGEVLRITRSPSEEKDFLSRIGRLGFAAVKPGVLETPAGDPFPPGLMGLSSEHYWPLFMEQIPALEKEGWEIEIPPDFRHRYFNVDQFEATVSERSDDWLSLNLGITVEGKRLSLVPLLSELFARDDRWLSPDRARKIPDNERIELRSPEGRIRLPADRLKVVVGTLVDLFDAVSQSGSPGDLLLSRFDASRISALTDRDRWQFSGPTKVREMIRRLSGLTASHPLPPPPEFRGALRPYQKEGLGWMQYLRLNGLSGVLADDMGLGKTAQALAHIALEKREGRLDRPALVVLPTSLVFNWQSEARRFTTGLSVIALHGKDRRDRFGQARTADLLLTTYPLLWRDADLLCSQDYHLLILDEAQVVKNAENNAARIVRKISARHRLCLTGTPLENHLGELWSLFDFLMPGFLGDQKSFTRSFRTPIEKQGDTRRRDILARRIRPFILRRKKEEVALELPSKTLTVHRVDIEGGQRDLYETVRSAMDRKIRQEIAERGFSRSRIVILDALLKLRQVCCDPRLLKSPTARTVKESAKLSLLLDLLPELLEEGRRILLFSQFTSMLDLIIPELHKRSISFVQLRGETVDRAAPVESFQTGRVPLFLVSLKAGGVGLNLTSADTVIHYDPWWNPAVENQATDRAHRIGQTKPVFVYKLIVAGSIEEKILGLQERKALLAEGILNPDHAGEAPFTPEDLETLFAPLPEES